MDRSSALGIALVLVAAPLAGCLGDDSGPIGEQNASNVSIEEPSAGNPAEIYRSGSNGSTLEGDDILGGLPVPVGIGRIVEAPLFEPTIGVSSEGTLFVSNTGKGEPTEEDPPPDTEYSSILRSMDNGSSWEDVTGSIGPVSIPPNTGDPYVYVDRDTDRVYNLDMIGLNCNWVRWSDDAGDSWISNPAGCGQPPVQDHPTLFSGEPTTLSTTGYENVLYLCVNRIADTACATSLDGGATWSPWRPVYPGIQTDRDVCGGLNGHGTTGPQGTVYLPKGQCGVPSVAISHDNGLTWETVEITTEVPTVSHEVAVATDDQGTVFAFWISEDLRPYLSFSVDQGASWSRPVDVGPPGVPVTSHPTIAAGSNGSVAMAYIGTQTAADSYQDMPENATWNAYITTIQDATRSQPVTSTTTANDPDHPIGLGVCGGTRCRAADDAGVGDFIDVTIDDEGRPWAAFVDVCLEECERTMEPQRQTGVGLVGTLAQGPSLTVPGEALAPLHVDATENGTSSSTS